MRSSLRCDGLDPSSRQWQQKQHVVSLHGCSQGWPNRCSSGCRHKSMQAGMHAQHAPLLACAASPTSGLVRSASLGQWTPGQGCQTRQTSCSRCSVRSRTPVFGLHWRHAGQAAAGLTARPARVSTGNAAAVGPSGLGRSGARPSPAVAEAGVGGARDEPPTDASGDSNIPDEGQLANLQPVALAEAAATAAREGLLLPRSWMEAYVHAARRGRMRGLPPRAYVDVLQMMAQAAAELDRWEALSSEQQQLEAREREREMRRQAGGSGATAAAAPGPSQQGATPAAEFGFCPTPVWVRGLMADAAPTLASSGPMPVAQAATLLTLLTRLAASLAPEPDIACAVFDACRPGLAAASFNDVAAMVAMAAEHGPPSRFWLQGACASLAAKSHQPSGGLGLRMYAMLLMGLRRLAYRPDAAAAAALVATGQRLLRADKLDATLQQTAKTLAENLDPSGVPPPPNPARLTREGPRSSGQGRQRQRGGRSRRGGSARAPVGGDGDAAALGGALDAGAQAVVIDSMLKIAGAAAYVLGPAPSTAAAEGAGPGPAEREGGAGGVEEDGGLEAECLAALQDLLLGGRVGPTVVQEAAVSLLAEAAQGQALAEEWAAAAGQGGGWDGGRETESGQPDSTTMTVLGIALQASEQAMPDMQPEQLIELVEAAAAAGPYFAVPSTWRHALYRSTRAALATLQPEPLARLLSALTTLGWRPPRRWVVAAARAFNERLKAQGLRAGRRAVAAAMVGPHEAATVAVFLADQCDVPAVRWRGGGGTLAARDAREEDGEEWEVGGGGLVALPPARAYFCPPDPETDPELEPLEDSSLGTSSRGPVPAHRSGDGLVQPSVGPQFLAALDFALCRNMDTLSPEGYSAATLALIRLGHMPSEEYWATLVAVSTGHLVGKASSRALTLMLLAFATSLVLPTPAWLEGCLIGVAQQAEGEEGSGSGLQPGEWSAVLWALGVLAPGMDGGAVPAAWVREAAATALPLLGGMEAYEVAAATCGLAALGWRPGASGERGEAEGEEASAALLLLRRAVEVVTELTPRAASSLAAGLATIFVDGFGDGPDRHDSSEGPSGHSPQSSSPQQLLHAVFARAESTCMEDWACSPSSSPVSLAPGGLAELLLAMQAVDHRPDRTFVDACAAAAARAVAEGWLDGEETRLLGQLLAWFRSRTFD